MLARHRLPNSLIASKSTQTFSTGVSGMMVLPGEAMYLPSQARKLVMSDLTSSRMELRSPFTKLN